MPATAALNPRPSIPRCRRPYLLGDKQGGLSGGGAGGQGGLPGVLLRVASVESGAWGADSGCFATPSRTLVRTRVSARSGDSCSLVVFAFLSRFLFPVLFTLFALEQCSRQ